MQTPEEFGYFAKSTVMPGSTQLEAAKTNEQLTDTCCADCSSGHNIVPRGGERSGWGGRRGSEYFTFHYSSAASFFFAKINISNIYWSAQNLYLLDKPVLHACYCGPVTDCKY